MIPQGPNGLSRNGGSIALVTGASGGIGAAVVLEFARRGMTVYGQYHHGTASAARVRTEAQRFGVRAEMRSADLSVAEEVVALADWATRQEQRLDVLVNCAGVFGPTADAENLTLEDWSNTLEVNLTAPFLLCRAVAPIMKRQGGGAIINVSALAGLRGSGPSAYCAAKAGLLGLTMSLARELGPSHVTVNAVAPGPTDTRMISEDYRLREKPYTLFGRLADPVEIARVIAFLSEQTFITGETINVSGGRHISL